MSVAAANSVEVDPVTAAVVFHAILPATPAATHHPAIFIGVTVVPVVLEIVRQEVNSVAVTIRHHHLMAPRRRGVNFF